jgi:hypothetical protein
MLLLPVPLESLPRVLLVVEVNIVGMILYNMEVRKNHRGFAVTKWRPHIEKLPKLFPRGPIQDDWRGCTCQRFGAGSPPLQYQVPHLQGSDTQFGIWI